MSVFKTITNHHFEALAEYNCLTTFISYSLIETIKPQKSINTQSKHDFRKREELP